jgi:hypothetical protein
MHDDSVVVHDGDGAFLHESLEICYVLPVIKLQSEILERTYKEEWKKDILEKSCIRPKCRRKECNRPFKEITTKNIDQLSLIFWLRNESEEEKFDENAGKSADTSKRFEEDSPPRANFQRCDLPCCFRGDIIDDLTSNRYGLLDRVTKEGGGVFIDQKTNAGVEIASGKVCLVMNLFLIATIRLDPFYFTIIDFEWFASDTSEEHDSYIVWKRLPLAIAVCVETEMSDQLVIATIEDLKEFLGG